MKKIERKMLTNLEEGMSVEISTDIVELKDGSTETFATAEVAKINEKYLKRKLDFYGNVESEKEISREEAYREIKWYCYTMED